MDYGLLYLKKVWSCRDSNKVWYGLLVLGFRLHAINNSRITHHLFCCDLILYGLGNTLSML